METRNRSIIKPSNDLCVIDKIPITEDTTPGGIIIQTTEQRFYARVRSVGPGELLFNGARAEVCVKPGDRVLVWGNISQFIIEGEKTLFTQASKIAAVLGPEREEDGLLKTHPCNDYVLVEKIKRVDFSPGGLHLVEQEYPTLFRVIDCGPGQISPDGGRLPMRCKPGDTVFIPNEVQACMSQGKQIMMTINEAIWAVLGPEKEDVPQIVVTDSQGNEKPLVSLN